MRRLIGIFRAAGVRFSRDGCAFLAQALAYNAIFAIIPLGLLAISVFGYVFGSAEGQALILSTIDDVAPALHDILAENIKNAVAVRGISGAIALVALIWSGKNLFQGLAFALNRALGVPAGRPWIHDTLLSIFMLPLMGLLLLLSTFVPPAVTFLAQAEGVKAPAIAQVTAYGVSTLLVFLVTATMYAFLPNRALPWYFGIPGAAFTAIAYNIAQIGFTIFTAHTNLFHIYGALSTVLALLLWFYLLGNIFLYGAELCAAQLEERTPAVTEPKSS